MAPHTHPPKVEGDLLSIPSTKYQNRIDDTSCGIRALFPLPIEALVVLQLFFW